MARTANILVLVCYMSCEKYPYPISPVPYSLPVPLYYILYYIVTTSTSSRHLRTRMSKPLHVFSTNGVWHSGNQCEALPCV